MIFFTDECIPLNAAHMLNHFEQEHEVRGSLDYFAPGTPDTNWMRVVTSWSNDKATVVVSGDGRILKNRVEKHVLKECGLMFVYLASGWMHLAWRDYGWKIVKVWPDVVRNVVEAPYPMVFDVSVGNLKVRAISRISNL